MTSEPVKHQTLQEAQREVARQRILAATKRMLAERGLRVTVEEIAVAAGLGRRTVFRYFATRELLLNEVMVAWVSETTRGMPAAPKPGQDPRDWLRQLADNWNKSLEVVGELLWDIHTRPEHLAEHHPVVLSGLTSGRKRLAMVTAHSAWVAFGGEGNPPPWAVDAFATQLSGYVRLNLGQLGRSPEQVVDSIVGSLEAIIKHAISEAAE